MKLLLVILLFVFSAGCSVVGQSEVNTAPYTSIISDNEQNIEVRNYESMILVSTSMSGDSGNSAFRKLFKYISGANEGQSNIAMTAPVFMDEKNTPQKGAEISMTSPVFMDESADTPLMSFVMPKDFTLASTPKPTNPEVKVTEVTNYKVAAIQFNGTLSDSNIRKYTNILTNWMTENGYNAISKPVTAGYNGPLTLPMWRRNEVLIEVN